MAAFSIVATKPRTIVYIDGFNLYYGAVKGTPFKWLNLQRYFTSIRQADEIVAIKYFTAMVRGSAETRQRTYLAALATCPLVEVVLGAFKNRRVTCSYSDCATTTPGDRRFSMPEEKRTDVNIAIYMIDDAYQDECDNLVLVTGDSDLVPAVKLIRSRFQSKRVTLYVPARVPQRGHAVELRTAAHVDRLLPLNMMPKMQFPARVADGSGNSNR